MLSVQLRVVVDKQEFRLQLDLHGWLIAIKMFQTTDWSVPLGRSIIASDEVIGVD